LQIAVVILNWNGKAYLEQFLPKVIAFSPQANIVLADNASTDDSVSWLKAEFPDIQLIQLDRNFGFAEGYNRALADLDADYFLLLNSDVEVTEGWLDPMIDLMRSDVSIAAVQPKILSYSNKAMFEHAGAAGGYIDKDGYPFCRGRIIDLFENDSGQYDDEQEIFWATGACFLVRAELFKHFKGFDERFFAHMEEIDLCWRFKNAGYRIMFTPKSTVFHVGGGALPYSNPRKTFLNFRNSLYMITRNYHGIPLWYKILKRLVLDGIAGLKFLIEGNAAHTWQIILAHFQFYGKIGTLLSERSALGFDRSKANRKGMFKRSIVASRYLEGKKKFSDLDPSYFS